MMVELSDPEMMRYNRRARLRRRAIPGRGGRGQDDAAGF